MCLKLNQLKDFVWFCDFSEFMEFYEEFFIALHKLHFLMEKSP